MLSVALSLKDELDKKRTVDLMLDSGVFSAWWRNETIDLRTYMAYVKRHKAILGCYVNVDSIPGEFGRKRTTDEVEKSAKIGYDNLQKMKAEGLSPIPVFHQGEAFSWLERMLRDGDNFIGLATSKDVTPNEQRKFLDTCFSALTDSQGRPLVKTHGFGITNPGLLFRYPWASGDSTTWSLTPSYGAVLVPRYVDGKPDYSRPPETVATSGVPSKKQDNVFDFMGPSHQENVRRYLMEECGVTMAEARYAPNQRRRAVLLYYLKLMEHLHDVRFKAHAPGLFRIQVPKGMKPVRIKHVKVVFALTTSVKAWSLLMNEIGANTRLLSYYDTRNKSDDWLRSYVRDGFVGEYAKRVTRADPKSESYRNQRCLALARRAEAYRVEINEV